MPIIHRRIPWWIREWPPFRFASPPSRERGGGAAGFVNEWSEVVKSESGQQHRQEGIVARSEPLMLDRLGNRIMWKLKVNDFPANVCNPATAPSESA